MAGHRQSGIKRCPVEYKGVKYNSYTHAATTFGLMPQTVKDRLAKGHPLEPRNMNQEIEGKK